MLKVFLCLYLAIALLLSACGGARDSLGESSAVSDFSSAHSGTVSNESDVFSEESVIEASSDLPDNSESSNGTSSENSGESSGSLTPVSSISSVNRTDSALNLAKGKKYTLSEVADAKYADDGKKLTDGNLESQFNTENWVGFIRPSSLVVVLDFGKVEQNLADFSVGTLRYMDYGVGSPESVQYEISNDGTVYQKIGTVYRPSDSSSVANLGYDLKLAEPVSARFIRFTIGKTDSTWIFLGELRAIRYIAEEEAASYYGDASLPEVTEPSYWSENEPDRDQTLNLIAGIKPLVKSKEAIQDDFATEYYNSLAALTKLTDGLFAKSATYADSELVHFTRSTERSLLFDLGHTSAVSGVLYSFLHESGPGVYAPAEFSVYLSEDGKGWQCVYTAKAEPNSEKELYKREAAFEKVYRTRFVKIIFSVSSHAFCDEVQIFGTKTIPENAVEIVPEQEKELDALGYIMPENFLGVSNVLLSYHCLEENEQHTEAGLITVEEYLPHVGYYNEAGELTDTFFDGYLYLPYTRFNYGDYARSLEGWNFYLNDIYTANRNMDALNQAVAQVKAELSLPDYHCTVFTSVLYPWKTLSDNTTVNTFGDLDGDGRNDSFASPENRKKAVKWMMDQEFNRFMEKNYENLEFGGFYWFEEAISVGSAEEKELILYASEYAHSLGVKIFWIPYYCASGYDRWQEYGFDLACMQPNYMFGNSGDVSVLQITAEKTSDLGMCVELEMNSVQNSDEVRRYMQYLAAGAEYGYMHAVKMYYQGGVPGVIYDAYCSTDPNKRAVYDLTYRFAKEKFTANAPAFATNELSYTCNEAHVKGETIAYSEGTYRFSLAVSPGHGDLQLNGDGSFVYYAEEGYTGTDRFAVVLDYGYAQSEEIVVTITVN